MLIYRIEHATNNHGPYIPTERADDRCFELSSDLRYKHNGHPKHPGCSGGDTAYPREGMMDYIAEAAFLMTGIPVNNRFVDGAKRTLLCMLRTGDITDIPYVRRMLAPYTMDICVQGIMDCLDHMED